jgi:gluconolactonase
MRQSLYFFVLMSVTVLAGFEGASAEGAHGTRLERHTLQDRSSNPSTDLQRIVGTRRDDDLHGTPADDLIVGRKGDDRLRGGEGNDKLRGGKGNDRLETTSGHDVLVGGPGEDSFYVVFDGSRTVTIRDFDIDDDHLLIEGHALDRLGRTSVQRARRGAALVVSRDGEELKILFRGVRKRALLRDAVIEFTSDFQGYGNLQVLEFYTDPLAHEGPVFLEDTEELVFTSNRLSDTAGNPFVVVSSYDTDADETTDLGLSDAIPMANGATLSRDGGIVFDRQGNLASSAGLSRWDPITEAVTDLVSSADGLAFNSPNDVTESSRGELLFTDPQYGYEQGFRPAPELGNYVWLYDRNTDALTRLVEDLVRPNGITLSNDEQFAYVTDSGWAVGDGSINDEGPRNVYRYRLDRIDGEVILSDRELLATAEVEIADGVKVDPLGNVWYSTGAGLHILSPTDEVLGSVSVPGGAANFAITSEGVFVMGETALYLLLPGDDNEDGEDDDE